MFLSLTPWTEGSGVSTTDYLTTIVYGAFLHLGVTWTRLKTGPYKNATSSWVDLLWDTFVLDSLPQPFQTRFTSGAERTERAPVIVGAGRKPLKGFGSLRLSKGKTSSKEVSTVMLYLTFEVQDRGTSLHLLVPRRWKSRGRCGSWVKCP